MDLNLYPSLPRKRDFRIGILGSGFIVCECHLPAYRKAGFNPVAIASRNRENALEAASRRGIPKVYDTYAQLLEDPTIEVLDIAVPPNALLDLIYQTCRRRTAKAILAQKPLGMNYAEADEAVRACKEAGILLAVNQNMRYDHSVRAAKTLLQNGTIGEPVLATIDMRGIPHWQPWQAELGWATLGIMSIHHLDTFRYWFGEPERIYCSTRPDPRTKFPHADGICTYILEYADGLRCVTIDDTWTGPAREGCPADVSINWRIEGLNGLAMGTIGWCQDPYTTPSTIRYASKGDTAFQAPVWRESWFPDAFSGTMGELLCALEEGREPVIAGSDNLKTIALVEAAYLSSDLHTTISPERVQLDHRALQSAGKTPFATSNAKRSWGMSFALLKSLSPPPDTQTSNFTPRAQQALALSRKEADRLNHHFVSTEHVLLGLIALGQGVAVNVLHKLGLNLDIARSEVTKLAGVGPGEKAVGNIPYTPRLKKVLALAAKAARALDHKYVGTEHLLLGLLEESDGVGARVLKKLGIDLAETRKEILKELDPNFTG